MAGRAQKSKTVTQMKHINNKQQKYIAQQIAEGRTIYDILLNEFANSIIFTLISKIPMDDWDFDGAFFTREQAEAAAKKSRQAYPDLPTYIEISENKVSHLKSYDEWDRKTAFMTLRESVI